MADEFKVHILNQLGLDAANDLAKNFDALLAFVRDAARVPTDYNLPNGQPPNGRELALVVTKLQEASFWAKRAIALNPANQQLVNPRNC